MQVLLILGALIAKPLAIVSFNESFANNVYNFKDAGYKERPDKKKSEKLQRPNSKTRIINFKIKIKDNEKNDNHLDEYFSEKSSKGLKLSFLEKIKFLL